jgi:glycosyltransferase involved in cell wall biosynthesis
MPSYKLVTRSGCSPSSRADPTIIRCPSWTELVTHHRWAQVVFENNPCLRLGWPKLLFGKPSVVILQTWLAAREGQVTLATRCKTAWLAQTNQVIAISTAVRERCWPPALLIGNTYDDNVFTKRPVARQQDFVFVGRLVSDKGADLAIQAFARLLAATPTAELATATLTIVGDGPDRASLQALAATLLPAAHVQFVGALQGRELAAELNRHSYQFIPSLWREPFGIVALEGIACGLIPIVSDGGGLPDAVGAAGVTFRRGELASLVAVTRQLLQSPAQQRQCRAAAPAHLAAFSAGRITGQVMAVVEAVLS